MVVRRSALQRSGDKNAPQALFKPICVQYGFRFFVTEKSKSVSSAAGRPGFQGAALNRFCILLSVQKDAPARQAYKPRFLKGLRRPAGRRTDCHSAVTSPRRQAPANCFTNIRRRRLPSSAADGQPQTNPPKRNSRLIADCSVSVFGFTASPYPAW